MYCNMDQMQISFISVQACKRSRNETSTGFAQYFVFRPAHCGTIFFGGERKAYDRPVHPTYLPIKIGPKEKERSNAMAKNRKKTAMAKSNVIGYLPNDQPPPLQMVLLGF